MTNSEEAFFLKLSRVLSNQYYIFPQIHLASILEHKVKGQGWKYAFGHINGKSVDYVLCDKNSLEIIFAVELDDYTHKYKNRKRRDREVERMLKNAGVQLIRIPVDAATSGEDILRLFTPK